MESVDPAKIQPNSNPKNTLGIFAWLPIFLKINILFIVKYGVKFEKIEFSLLAHITTIK